MSLQIHGIGDLACQALYDEVRVFPKPGLVTPFSRGAHADMDFFHFLCSIRALRPYFSACVDLGKDWAQKRFPISLLLQELKPLGRTAERNMLKATEGINTHKGAIFSLGILCAAAGNVFDDDSFGIGLILSTAARITAGVVELDFGPILCGKPPQTAGERFFLSHGITGARGQAESGFKEVREHALPVLRQSLQAGLSFNDGCVNALLELMVVTDDTNILHRAGFDGLCFVKHSAAAILACGGVYTSKGKKAVDEFDKCCVEKNISPGGAADLLAVTIFLHSIEKTMHPLH